MNLPDVVTRSPPSNATVMATLSVLTGSRDRTGRATTEVATKSGVRRVFWKRGRWRVRLEQWTSAQIMSVELHSEDKAKMVTTLWQDEESGPHLVLVPKFQPMVSFSEVMREVQVTIWENHEIGGDLTTVKPPTRSRVGFFLVVHALDLAKGA